MSEIGVNPHGEIGGLQNVGEEKLPGRPLSHKVQDVLQDQTPQARHTRRTVLGALAAGGLGLTTLGTIVKEGSPEVYKSQDVQPLPQSTPTPESDQRQLENDIRFLIKNESEGLDYSNVAQYYDATFSQLENGQFAPIPIRNEHRYDAVPEEELKPIDMNDHGIGVIRVAGSDNDRPQDSFKDKDGNDIYEWLLLVRLTPGEEKPYVYVDGLGNVTDKPYFVSPNYASLKSDTMQLIDEAKNKALQ